MKISRLTIRRVTRALLHDAASPIPVVVLLANSCLAQTAFTWQQIRQKFERTNPTLKASELSIDESRAAEITAYLRPNPDLSLTADGFQISRNQGVWRPLSGVLETPAVSYLHERQHKRELRRDTAQESTAVAESTYSGSRAQPVVQSAKCLCRDSASEGGAPERPGEPGLLGSRAGHKPDTLQRRRPGLDGSEPPGIATRPVRIRL